MNDERIQSDMFDQIWWSNVTVRAKKLSAFFGFGSVRAAFGRFGEVSAFLVRKLQPSASSLQSALGDPVHRWIVFVKW